MTWLSHRATGTHAYGRIASGLSGTHLLDGEKAIFLILTCSHIQRTRWRLSYESTEPADMRLSVTVPWKISSENLISKTRFSGQKDVEINEILVVWFGLISVLQSPFHDASLASRKLRNLSVTTSHDLSVENSNNYLKSVPVPAEPLSEAVSFPRNYEMRKRSVNIHLSYVRSTFGLSK
jgi:hypothetical protein